MSKLYRATLLWYDYQNCDIVKSWNGIKIEKLNKNRYIIKLIFFKIDIQYSKKERQLSMFILFER